MVKPVITNKKELSKKAKLVEEGEDISQIIIDLRDTMATLKGYGLAANQIGYDRAVSLITINGEEAILVNPIILSREKKFLFKGECCFSFPGISVNTDRWASIVIKSGVGEDIIEGPIGGIAAVVIQHEVDHLNGLTIFNKKHKSKK